MFIYRPNEIELSLKKLNRPVQMKFTINDIKNIDINGFMKKATKDVNRNFIISV